MPEVEAQPRTATEPDGGSVSQDQKSVASMHIQQIMVDYEALCEKFDGPVAMRLLELGLWWKATMESVRQ